MEDIQKIDLYKLLNINFTASEDEIRKAYRKKALTCHPDKNPDNPKAAELFQQLSKALEILTDGSAKAAYDRVLKAKKANELRNQALDSKRKKLKEDLEARERSRQNENNEESDARKLQKEIERLREEGSRILEEERERVEKEFNERMSSNRRSKQDPELPRLKLRWKSKKSDVTNGGYSYDTLMEIFAKYGNILLVMSKKRGSALLEFPTVEAALSAQENEIGHQENPLQLTWIGEKPETRFHNEPSVGENSTITFRDYESLVMMRLRQAEERKKLIQQIKEEEGQ